MKILVSFIIFFAATVISIQSLAKEEHRDNSALFPPKEPNKALSTVPAATSLSEPAFMAKVSGSEVTLKWAAVEGVETYHVQVATDPVYKWLTVDEKLYKGTSLQLKDLQPGKHYYWRVAAFKAKNMNSFSKGEFTKSMFETAEK